MILLNLFLSPEDSLCAIPKHAMVFYTISTAAYFYQTVNSPMYDTYMSTPGNTAKLGQYTAIYRQCLSGKLCLDVGHCGSSQSYCPGLREESCVACERCDRLVVLFGCQSRFLRVCVEFA